MNNSDVEARNDSSDDAAFATSSRTTPQIVVLGNGTDISKTGSSGPMVTTTGIQEVPEGIILLYIFIPCFIILSFGAVILLFKYVKRRNRLGNLRRQLVPLRQYEVNSELAQDSNLLGEKIPEPCSKDPLLAFSPLESSEKATNSC